MFRVVTDAEPEYQDEWLRQLSHRVTVCRVSHGQGGIQIRRSVAHDLDITGSFKFQVIQSQCDRSRHSSRPADGPGAERSTAIRIECSADSPLTPRSRPGAGLRSCEGSFQVNGRASLATPAQIHPSQTGLDRLGGDRYSLVQAQARGSNRERPGPGPGGWDFELQVAGGARIVPVIH